MTLKHWFVGALASLFGVAIGTAFAWQTGPAVCIDGSGASEARLSACTSIAENTNNSAERRAAALAGRASIFLARRDPIRALADYDSAIVLTPQRAALYAGRGSARQLRREYAEALADFDHAASIEPNNANFHYERARTLGALQRYDESLDGFNRVIALDPNFVAAYRLRSRVYVETGDLPRAISDYDTAVRLAPNDGITIHRRHYVHKTMGDYGSARADLDRALELDPSIPAAWNDRGWLRLELGDYEGAVGDFEQAVRRLPDFHVASHNRAWAKLLMREYAGAIQGYTELLTFTPNAPRVLVERGVAYYQTNDLDRASADFASALAADADLESAQVGQRLVTSRRTGVVNLQTHLDHAFLQEFLRDHLASAAAYDRAAALQPESPGLHNQRCWSRALAGEQLDVAIAACNRALELSDNAPSSLDSRALAYLRNGDFQHAWNDYDAALRANPEGAHFLYGRGIAALRLGRAEDGRADIARALIADQNVAIQYAGYGVLQQEP